MTRCVVVGSGAREHALAHTLAADNEVVVSPGSPGIAAHGINCVATDPTELSGDLFVVGPEQPLVAGLADRLRAQGKTVVGPGAAGARLEGSKAYMKEFLASAGVPSARYGAFDNELDALEYLSTLRPPYVVKTDGLAAGKGVLVTNDVDEAARDLRAKLSGRAFGDAGRTVVLEEGLAGEECSLHVLCDGDTLHALVAAQDFKRVGENDRGANTGGMGAYAPMTTMSPSRVDEVMARVVAPTLAELSRRSIDYRGVLYAGLMVSPHDVNLLEYNVRFGDPETQVIAPLYGAGLFDLLWRTGRGELAGATTQARGAAVTVVLAAEGYPANPRLGDRIDGLAADGQLAAPAPGVTVFHGATARARDGGFVTAGGRVLALTAVGEDVADARRRAYDAVGLVNFDGRVVRGDVARAAVEGDS